MTHWLFLLALVAVPAAATELPPRALFFPSGAAPTQYNTVSPVFTNAGSGNGISTFIYVTPLQWSFWWRGQRIAADAVPAAIIIESVTPTQLIFSENGQKYGFEVGKFVNTQ